MANSFTKKMMFAIIKIKNVSKNRFFRGIYIIEKKIHFTIFSNLFNPIQDVFCRILNRYYISINGNNIKSMNLFNFSKQKYDLRKVIFNPENINQSIKYCISSRKLLCCRLHVRNIKIIIQKKITFRIL